MALRYAQIELTIEMFLKAFHAEKDKDRRYELIIQFEDSFDGSIENWKERIEDRICEETLKEEFHEVVNRKERPNLKGLCVIEPLKSEHKKQISFLGARNLELLGWGGREDSFDDFINSGFSFVVKRENVILGFTMAYKCPTYGGSYFIYLDTLIVDEGARGKGIGRMMMEHLYKLACEQMIYEIKLMTTKDRPAYQIYKHLGFQDMDKYVHMNCWGW